MRVHGINSLNIAKTLSPDDLNLKEGQKVIGKVITNNMEEALLDIAGRTIKARIEGDPQIKPGAVLKFLVAKDPQSTQRIILKIVPASLEHSELNSETDELSLTQPDSQRALTLEKTVSDQLQRRIVSSLEKNGLPITRENIDKVLTELEKFHNKYQLPLKPEVLTFLLSKKLPFNPNTILAAWLYQDKAARNTLWNLLANSSLSTAEKELLNKLILDQQASPDLLKLKMKELCRQFDNEVTGKSNDVEKLINLLKKPPQNTEIKKDISYNNYIRNNDNNPNEAAVDSSIKRKIATLLEQNLSLNKSNFSQTQNHGPEYVYPLLVQNSQGLLNEIIIKWQDQSDNKQKDLKSQVLYLTVPTEHMGEINLILQVSLSGSNLNLRVDSEQIKNYLLQNCDELKGVAGLINVTVAVSNNEQINSGLTGVDLWM